MINTTDSLAALDEQLKQMAEDIITNRVKQWASYYFEKELLPHLQAEIKERLTSQILTVLERHNEFKLDVHFKLKDDNS